MQHPLFTLLLGSLLFLLGCAEAEKPAAAVTATTPGLPIIQELEQAHQVEAFKEHPIVAFDIELYFRGKLRLEGTVYSRTNSSAVRLERKDGSAALYDGQTVWADSSYGSARFDVLTWQYFFMAPFKLSDPGTHWTDLGQLPLNGKAFPAAKLTFADGTGDAPDDWYIAYKNERDLLECLAYIVTYRKSPAEAEVEPHAISYHNYEALAGVPIASNWKFWMWSEAEGIYDQLGEANIRNVRFPETADFEKWPSAVEMQKE